MPPLTRQQDGIFPLCPCADRTARHVPYNMRPRRRSPRPTLTSRSPATPRSPPTRDHEPPKTAWTELSPRSCQDRCGRVVASDFLPASDPIPTGNDCYVRRPTSPFVPLSDSPPCASVLYSCGSTVRPATVPDGRRVVSPSGVGYHGGGRQEYHMLELNVSSARQGPSTTAAHWREPGLVSAMMSVEKSIRIGAIVTRSPLSS